MEKMAHYTNTENGLNKSAVCSDFSDFNLPICVICGICGAARKVNRQ